MDQSMTQEEKREHVFETLSFRKPFRLSDGEELFFDDEGNVVDSKGDWLNMNEYLILQFNEKTYKHIVSLIQRLGNLRGLLSPDQITTNHPAVQQLKKRQYPNKRVDDSVMESLRQAVVTEMQPFYLFAMLQACYLGMMNADLFVVDTTSKKKSVVDKLNVTVPSDYWDGAEKKSWNGNSSNSIDLNIKEEEESTALDEILGSFSVIKPNLSKTNPLEQLAAIATQVLVEYSEFQEKTLDYFQRVFQGVLLIMQLDKYDDFRILNAHLDSILSGTFSEELGSLNGENTTE